MLHRHGFLGKYLKLATWATSSPKNISICLITPKTAQIYMIRFAKWAIADRTIWLWWYRFIRLEIEFLLTPSGCQMGIRVITFWNLIEMKWSQLSSCSYYRAFSRRVLFLPKMKKEYHKELMTRDTFRIFSNSRKLDAFYWTDQCVISKWIAWQTLMAVRSHSS